jgi:hypothetical protein
VHRLGHHGGATEGGGESAVGTRRLPPRASIYHPRHGHLGPLGVRESGADADPGLDPSLGIVEFEANPK